MKLSPFVTVRELMRLVDYGVLHEDEIIELGPQPYERMLVEKVYQLRQTDAALRLVALEVRDGTNEPGEPA